MTRIILFLIIVSTLLFSKENYELKLYEKILPSIFTKQRPIVVYAQGEVATILRQSTMFRVVQRCEDSVVVLVGRDFKDLSSQCQSKPLFATSYRSFKDLSNSFGAFYWRKGRPQIKFKEDAVIRMKLKLPMSLQKYLQ